MVRLSTIFDSELNQRMFLIMGDLVRIVATSIELDADKNTGKYKESVTFTATVKDKDSNPVGGVTVSFYNVNSRIGASVTNSNGVATFNYELTHDLSVNARGDYLTSNTVGIELIHDYNMDVVLDKSIIQTGETATFTTTLTDNNIPLSGENVTYSYNGITEYVTTLDGEAKLPYTGTGKGDVEFVIKYGTLLQETYEVIDAIYFDSASSDNTSRYTFNTSVGNSLTFEDGYYLMTGGTGSRYITYSMSNVSALIGKTIRIEADLNTSDNVALGIFPHNSEGYVNYLSNWFKGEGTFHFDVELSDTIMDSCLFRIYVKTTNATVEIKNLKIYPI